MHGDPETWRVAIGDRVVDLVTCGGDLEAELRRRDLTINAMALPLALAARGCWETEELVDPTGGLADLRAGLVRATSPHSLADDPLRVLRVARFAAVLGFRVDPGTARQARVEAAHLADVAGERLAKELLGILSVPALNRAIALLRDLRCLEPLFPELAALAGIDQGGYHHLDAFEHSLEAVRMVGCLLSGGLVPEGMSQEALEAACDGVMNEPLVGVRSRRAMLALAALLHDIGKAPCREVTVDGRVRFQGHEIEGSAMAGEIARRLRLTSRETRYLKSVVRLHMRPCLLAASGTRPTPRALGRLVRAAAELLPDIALVSLGDRLAARGTSVKVEICASQAQTVSELLALWKRSTETPEERPVLVTGSDLMRDLGLDEGPVVGRLLSEIGAAAVAGEVTTHEAAMALAAQLLAEDGRETTAEGAELDDG